MADFPALGQTTPWRDQLKAYIDEGASRAAGLSDQAVLDRSLSQARSRVAWEDADSFIESWANLSAWSSGTAVQVSGGKVYANGGGANSGINHAFPVAAGETATFMFNISFKTGGSGGVVVGVSSDSAGGAFTTGAGKVRGLYFRATTIQAMTDGVNSADLVSGLTADAEYLVTIVVDENYISAYAVTTAGSFTETRYKWTRSGFAVNNVAVFNSDIRDLTGHAVGKISARKSTVTTNPRTGINGTQRTGVWTTVNGDGVHAWFPPAYDSRKPMPVVVLFHGNGSDETHWYSNGAGKAVREKWLSEGYICLAAANTGAVSTWGASAGLDAYVNAYRWLRDHYSIGPIVFYANSMGGIESLLTLADDRIPGVVAWVGTVPTTSLRKNYDNALFKTTIAAAYGIATDGSNYTEKTDGHDPLLLDPNAFRGVPMYALVATDDTSVLPADNWDLFGPQVASYSREYVRQDTTGGHSTPTISSSTFLTPAAAFVRKYVGPSV